MFTCSECVAVEVIFDTKTLFPFKDLSIAMKKLGLNPTETEIQDLINEIEVNGFIYYQAFCRYNVQWE